MQARNRQRHTCKILVSLFVHLGWLDTCYGQTPADTLQIFKDKMSSNVYSSQVRPAINQSEPTLVNVSFHLLSIVEVDDVKQQFHCNGYLQMEWIDELLQWNPADYGGQFRIHPLTKDIWRPRVVLQNTLEDRDIFEDDHAPLVTYYTGRTDYYPGSLFSSSCDLDMTYYPYDTQTCSISLVSMGWAFEEIIYVTAQEEVSRDTYSPHDEWEILESRVDTSPVFEGETRSSSIRVTFKIQRRSSFLMLNLILPVVFLSLMNLLVFVIPEESGEKLSYGITVLLALTLYLSIISSMLPRSSDNLPLVNKYIFILLVISILTVIDSIVIVFLSHMEQKEDVHLRAKENFKNSYNKVTQVRQAVQSFKFSTVGVEPSLKLRPGSAPILSPDYPSRRESQESYRAVKSDKPAVNRYKIIGKHINLISLIVFSLIWICVTLGFMAVISTSGG